MRSGDAEPALPSMPQDGLRPRPPGAGPGPARSYRLTRKRRGKTVTLIIPAHAGAEIAAENAEYAELRTDCAGPDSTLRTRGALCRPPLETFLNVLGPCGWNGPGAHCGACRAGWSPRDPALGLQGASLTPGAMWMVGFAAAEISFARGGRAAGRVGRGADRRQAKQVELAVGCEIAADERAIVEPAPGPAPTMYLEAGRHRRAGAPRRGRRPPRKAARRRGQDPRGQAGRRRDY